MPGSTTSTAHRAHTSGPASQARLAGIIEMASDAIISVDEESRITLFNKGAEAIFGWKAEEAIGEPLSILLPERYRATHGGHIGRFGASASHSRRMGERREISGLRRNGEEFPAEASIVKTTIEGERIYSVVLRDVTDRHRAEGQKAFLIEVGELLGASLDLETTLIAVADCAVGFLADYCIVDLVEDEGSLRRLRVSSREGFDQGAAVLRGAGSDDGPPFLRHILSTGQSELVPEMSADHLTRIAQNPSHEVELRRLNLASYMAVPLQAREKKVGTLLLLASRQRRPYDAQDLDLAREVGFLAGMAVDNARLYHDAQRAISARDDLLAVVSHDLGNPLQAVFIGVEALERAGPNDGDRYYLSAIRRSADLMQRLIHELLEVRRMEEGHLALTPTDCALSPLVDEAIDLIEPLARVKSISLSNDLDSDLPLVRTDRERVLQVFSNLVGNAVKHTPPSGSVTVKGERDGSWIRVSVMDTGSGIPPEDHEHVFERFWRGEGEQRGKGIGLGLAIARSIVRAHGGRIWVEGEVGSGSTFHFTVPAADG